MEELRCDEAVPEMYFIVGTAKPGLEQGYHE